ncbi:hypothetical protein [Nocardia noduli]|uniref:hypothetical protein n=1 Tax=Nocardia noduli TaxID=2815722 RepID=UPI001C243802|nr:hypothetical protein [Nocardia noduli]
MAAKGFADITPGHDTGPARSTAPETTPPSPPVPGLDAPRTLPDRVPWRWVGAIAAAVLLVAVVMGALSGPESESGAGASVRAAHGPTRVVDNVPAGYTRDQAGAATAAVNIVQALAQAGHGRVQMDAVVATMIAQHPGPDLARAIEIGRDRAAEDAILNVLPAAVTVTAFTDTTAEVTVWTMGVSRASIAPGDPVSVMTLWTTNTVSLVWQDEDWKAVEKSGRIGPSPDEVVAPNSASALTKPLLEGYYTFYLN